MLEKVVQSVKKEPLTSTSLLVSILMAGLSYAGIIKPLFIEIQLSGLSLISSAAQSRTIFIGTIFLVISAVLFIVLMMRLRK